MRMLAWYKSWFRRDGTLELDGFVQHVAAAFGFFFGFFTLAAGTGFLALWTLAALHAPTGVAWLVIAANVSLGLLAIGSWTGILVTATIRFARFLIANCASPAKSRP